MKPGFLVERWHPQRSDPDLKHCDSDQEAKEAAQAAMEDGQFVRVFAVVELFNCVGPRTWKADATLRATLAKAVNLQVQGREQPPTEG